MQPIDLSEMPLDWTLARERFERDVRDDFFPDPYRNRDLFVAAKARFESVLRLAEYVPESAESWDVPKANFTLRHSINVSPVDRLVYQALVDQLAATCDEKFIERSYAFRLRNPPSPEMYKGFVEQKGAFEKAVRERLNDNPNAIVVAIDVAQYFENISFSLLKAKLVDLTNAKLGHPTRAIIDVLITCLSHWSPYGHRGLPQNMFPSSFLGNVFLHSFDEMMVGAGFDCHRYMDDVRIVTPDETTARRALKRAITHLRDLELSVNGKKTSLLRPDTVEWMELVEPPDPQLGEIETVVRRGDPAELPLCIATLNEMLATQVEQGGRHRKTLRFVLGRLTSLRRLRRIPVPEPESHGPGLLELMKWLPEETTYICDYFHSGECTNETLAVLVALLTEDALCVYGWQNYHLWLLAAEKAIDSQSLLERARQIIRKTDEAPEIAGAALFLGAAGEAEDLPILAAMLRSGDYSISVRRALCIAVQRLTKDQREPVWAQVATSSATLSVLVRYLSKLREPRYVARPRRVSLRLLVDEMPDNFS